jgi:hypothetical protein
MSLVTDTSPDNTQISSAYIQEDQSFIQPAVQLVAQPQPFLPFMVSLSSSLSILSSLTLSYLEIFGVDSWENLLANHQITSEALSLQPESLMGLWD